MQQPMTEAHEVSARPRSRRAFISRASPSFGTFKPEETRESRSSRHSEHCGWSLSEMSNVQLSNAAMERLVARRTFPLHKRTGVCRSLFGPVDHVELNREMEAKLREISERDQQRWNFNFEANAPLDGRYQWEELPQDSTPLFYQEKRSSLPATPVKQRPDADAESDPAAAEVLERLSAPESSGAAELNQENRKLTSGRAAHRQVPCVRRKRPAADNNTHITDFFVKRKRVVDRKPVDSCLQSKAPIPVEQTPRKRIR